jgi:hypothetical protein
VAWQEDHYVLRGDAGGETFTPRWTWHAGRYVMATGDAAALAALDVGATRCFPLRSDVAVAGAWRSSSPLLNAIHAADVTTMESNMMSVQSDCPHRERLGYGGDALMSAESFILNFDMALFYGKRLDDVAASQRPNGGFTETAPYVGIDDAGLGDGSARFGTAGDDVLRKENTELPACGAAAAATAVGVADPDGTGVTCPPWPPLPAREPTGVVGATAVDDDEDDTGRADAF